jgi:hypothetical protein
MTWWYSVGAFDLLDQLFAAHRTNPLELLLASLVIEPSVAPGAQRPQEDEDERQTGALENFL